MILLHKIVLCQHKIIRDDILITLPLKAMEVVILFFCFVLICFQLLSIEPVENRVISVQLTVLVTRMQAVATAPSRANTAQTGLLGARSYRGC